ncbi:MAG TPA: acetate/propionate family kinase [Burkholderiales bacterium]|nr:acetate/propionate family kinase [Burkholderiales bacterium]
MAESILALNVGSSSVKFAVYAADGRALRCRGAVEQTPEGARLSVSEGATSAEQPLPHSADLKSLLDAVLDWLDAHGAGADLAAAGHRVVHGGERFTAPVLIDANVLAELEHLTRLAPLHQPENLEAVRALKQRDPKLPQVACFDTAFHRNQPKVAREFGLPRELTESGIRRYGFHGLSYEYVAGMLPQYVGGAAARTVVAHLGSGASLCALREGQSVATTMGFSVLDGLIMGTRCGALDPGVILYLLRERGLSAEAIEDLLYSRSGLLGVSGISEDMRTLLASADPAAKDAVQLFVYRIVGELGSLVFALQGLDALVFTGGIGERAASVRAAVVRELGWLGVDLDEKANGAHGPRISSPQSRVEVLVIPTDEEATIARHTSRLLNGAGNA